LKIIVAAIAGFLAMWVTVGITYPITKNIDLAWAAGLVVGWLVVPALILTKWRSKGPAALYPESLFVVTVTPSEISVLRPDGDRECVALSDLQEIVVVTNSSGPWGMDVWWLLVGLGPNSGCAFPGGATGEEDVVIWTETLDGFDTKAFIAAMGCTTEARFSCWARAA